MMKTKQGAVQWMDGFILSVVWSIKVSEEATFKWKLE